MEKVQMHQGSLFQIKSHAAKVKMIGITGQIHMKAAGAPRL
jgi:hypothetical protein